MIFNYNYHTHRLHSVSHINQGLCFYQKTGFTCNSKQVGKAIQSYVQGEVSKNWGILMGLLFTSLPPNETAFPHPN